MIGQNVLAQTNSLAISKTNPTPTPGFGTADSVNAANGFTSTNTGTFKDFAPFQTDTITSPLYLYTTTQSVIYFNFNMSAAASGVNTNPIALIITSAGDTLTASSSQNVKGASTDYYFTFNLATPLPANTVFKIAVIMTLGNKAVTAQTLSINAQHAAAQSSIPLPVKFGSFTAQKLNAGVSLVWNVATEMNVSSYEVQRSSDGNSFTTIGSIAAGGKPSYNFVDSKSFDKTYYRIQSTDIDGKHGYSTIVAVLSQQSSVIMKAFPNPIQNQLTVQHNTANTASKIEIVSVDGRLIKSVSIASGAQQTTIDLSSAKAGVYAVRFINGNNTESLKLVKQ